MYKLRNATIDDLPNCLVCAKKFVDFYGLEWDRITVLHNLTTLISSGVFIIAEVDDTVVAGIGGITTKNMWNSKQDLFQELFWWVDEEYRSGSLAIKLLKTLENQAPEGALLVLSVLPKSNIKEETLSKLGYSLREQAYTKD